MKTYRSNNSNSNASFASTNRSYGSKRSSQAPDMKSVPGAIFSVRRNIKAFKKQHMATSRFEYQKCAECLQQDVLPQWKMSSEQLESHEDFLRLTLRKPLDEDTASSEDFVDLLGISEMAQDFGALLEDTKSGLFTCMNNRVLKTCKSLKEEEDEGKLTCVVEYDKFVHRYRSDVESKIMQFHEEHDSYQESSKPFLNCVENGEERKNKMKTICKLLLELCLLLEEWLKEDESYPHKLEQEMTSKISKKMELQENIEKIKREKEFNIKDIQRLHKLETRSEKGYREYRRDKRKLKLRLVELEERKHMLEEKVVKKRESRDRLKQDVHERGPLTPRESYDITEQLAYLDLHIGRLEEQRKLTQRQLARVGRDMKPTNDKAYEFKVEMVTYRHQRENLQKANHDLDSEIKSFKEQIDSLDSCNVRLKNIREMKLSGEAFRKHMRLKQRQEVSYSDGTHDLIEACKVAAPSIGKDWKKVYLCLPFDPPRDPDKREHDVAVIDFISARNDVTHDEQALKCLEKWRTFHRKGDVTDLIQALKEVKKRRIANELQNRFVGVAV